MGRPLAGGAAPLAPPITVASIEAYRQALYAAETVRSNVPGAAGAATAASTSAAGDGAGGDARLASRLAAMVRGVELVILDDFQSLSDRKRGTMWEESLLWAPRGVQTVALSSIVRGSEGLQAWLVEVMGGCDLVVCEKSPLPLRYFFLRPGSIALMGGRMSPSLLAEEGARKAARSQQQQQQQPSASDVERRRGDEAAGGGGNGAGAAGSSSSSSRTAQGLLGGGGGSGPLSSPPSPSDSQSILATRRPSLRYVLWQLQQRHMLPAVFFIFSRVACNAAVHEVARAGLEPLVTPAESARIRARLEVFQAAHPGLWRADDAEALMGGIAAHHAGLLPAWRELVECLAVDGLLPLLFSTETLASSIKIPMRTVVLSSLSKIQHNETRRIQASELTALLSRVGRRGQDSHGNVIVLQVRRGRGGGVAQNAGAGAGARGAGLRKRFAPAFFHSFVHAPCPLL